MMNHSHNVRTDTSGVDGFSLLEVLVATTLVGLMLVILLQILSSIIRTEEAIWKTNRAMFVAEKVLQENCELVGLETGLYEGQEEGFSYQVQVTPQYQIVDNTARNLEISSSLIRVTVFWLERHKTKSLMLETVRTAPKQN